MKYTEKLYQAILKTGSVLCVGLDPVPSRIPNELTSRDKPEAQRVLDFCKVVIEQTKDIAAAYKPNLGFFEALGAEGMEVFQQLKSSYPDHAITIADAKRGDIGNTAHRYKTAFFDVWNYDAITLSPLMGFDTISPFLTEAGRAVYVLTLTSNPGSADILQQKLASGETVSSLIAEKSAEFNQRFPAHTGMVLGATQAVKLPDLLKKHPEGALLIPGVGSQGGDVEALRDALQAHRGLPLINVSRSITYSTEPAAEDNPAEQIRTRALAYHEAFKSIAQQVLSVA